MSLKSPSFCILLSGKTSERGFGRTLIKTMINSFMIDTLAVWTDEDAVGFYEKIGFNIVNEIQTLNGLVRYKLRFSRAKSLGRLET